MKNSKKVHISIEGIDGSGKTSVAKLLAEKMKYQFIEKPMSNIIGIQEYKNCVPILNETQSGIVKNLFYACGNAYTVELEGNKVTDRHLVSNYYHNNGENNEKLFEVLIEILGKPKLTVLLICDNEKRKKRMLERNPKDKDIEKVFEFTEEKIQIMRNFLLRYDFNYIEINNTNLTVEETVEIILKELNK